MTNACLEYFNNDVLAASVASSKYLLPEEDTPKDKHIRLSNEFARIEKQYTNPLSAITIFKYLNKYLKIIPQGSPMAGIGNKNLQSLSNCFVIDSPKDSLSDIFDTSKKMANIFKNRGGVGIDISTLRPKGASVANAAKTSTGAYSFGELYSFNSQIIGQAGRRAALMLSLDIKHPDAEYFTQMKLDTSKVNGANISLKISDKFMEAVKNDEDFFQTFPCNKKIDKNIYKYQEYGELCAHTCASSKFFVKKIKAKKLWKLITATAHASAEPGILFWDKHKRNLPANEYSDFKIVTVNPCAEISLSPNDSCRLMAINLKSFVENPFTDQAYFNYESFKDTCKVITRLADDLVDLETEKINQIAEKANQDGDTELFNFWNNIAYKGVAGRRVGIGTTGLADALARLELIYGSSKGISETDNIYRTLRDSVYETSSDLAVERGCFKDFDWELEKDNIFIQNLPDNIKEKIKKHGRRNNSLLTNAPTGSVSIVAQTSSGIEPVFKNSYIRRRRINVGETYDIKTKAGDEFIEVEVYHHNVKEYKAITGREEIPEYFVTAEDIHWKDRIKMQSTIQKYIDSSISSTINLPKSTKVKTISEIYMEAYDANLKGITVYVEDCREGVLVSNEKGFPKKRPKEVDLEIHHSKISGNAWIFFVGILNNKPYEIFGGCEGSLEIINKYHGGKLIKRSKNHYDVILTTNNLEHTKTITNIEDSFGMDNGSLTRIFSKMLQSDIPVHEICSTLKKITKDTLITSFERGVYRILAKYIKNGTESNETCDCGTKYIFQEGCQICPGCGHTYCS